MGMTNTATATRRYFGRCIEKGCKFRIVTEGATAGPRAPRGCPDHRISTDWRDLKAKRTEKECNGVCMGAVGPSCDCSCGGENHGVNHL